MDPRVSTRKIVFTPAPGDRQALIRAVSRTKYASVSGFVREAVHEKLARMDNERMFAAVERYCAVGCDDDSDELLAAQAIDDEGA